MSGISFEGRIYPYREGETVLDALVRGGASVTYSCRRGTCQSCILQFEGDAATLVQARLPRARFDAGTFLACQTQAAPISVKRLDRNALFVPARVSEKTQLAVDVLRIRLEPPGYFMWYPGQYVNLRHPDGTLRSFAITSLAAVDYWLELHVRYVPNGAMSQFLRDELQVGQFIELQGPFGDCHYCSSMAHNRLLLMANGVGLGALLGLVRDAAIRRHIQPVSLYHGPITEDIPHLTTALEAARNAHPNLILVECKPTANSRPGEQKSLDALASALPNDLANTAIFLCGSAALLQRCVSLALARGATEASIHTLEFEP